MKINAVISPRVSVEPNGPKNKIQLLSFAVIASSVIIGTLIFILSEDYISCDILSEFEGYFSSLENKNTLEVFTGFLLSHIPYIMLMIVLGTCTYGTAFILILSFLKISGLSFLNAVIYSTFGLKGIEYSLLVSHPGKFVLLLSVLLMTEFCIENSQKINSRLKGESKKQDSNNLYALKVAAAVLLFIFSSLVDCFFTVSFSSLFSF